MTACAHCGHELQEEFRFCPYCGAGAAAPVMVEPARERRVVSILFCDVAGFTAASADADPEDVRARMDAYYGMLRPVIEAFGGTVQKFIGDAVMAVFGAPVAHEDDPERAVRAGLAILGAAEEQNAANPGLDLVVRIGVNTGEAVVDLDVQSGSGEAIALGDTVNTAARIQVAAPVSAVAVAEATFRATEPVFDYEPLDPVVAKGKAEPLAVWRALAPRARLGSDVIRSLATPLVGRRRELAALTDALEESVRARAVRLVTVVAEPGTGKSRLVAELGRFVDTMPLFVVWRQGRCLPFGDGITFWALGEIVKAHAGIYDSDSVEVATAKLEQALPEGEDRVWLRTRLLPLLGIERGEPGSQQELFSACRRFLEKIAERSPLAIVVEDIHWADEAMLAFLEHLVATTRDVPLLVLCTARPELFQRRPGWGTGLANAETLAVGPLSDDETARLVSILLDRAVLPAATQQLLLERVGGNPLHAEEFVRMLRDRGLVDEHGRLAADSEIVVPSSIHALIAARLDTLAPDRKRLLQDAAVIGKVFWAGAAATMGEREPAAVAESLARARPARADPSGRPQLDGRRDRVQLLARARARRRLQPDPPRAARDPAPPRRRLDRGQGRRAGGGGSRGARLPHRGGTHARAGDAQPRPGGGGHARRGPVRAARRGAGSRPRCRESGRAARACTHADSRRRSRVNSRAAPLGRGRRGLRPARRGGAGAREHRGGARDERRRVERRPGVEPARLHLAATRTHPTSCPSTSEPWRYWSPRPAPSSLRPSRSTSTASTSPNPLPAGSRESLSPTGPVALRPSSACPSPVGRSVAAAAAAAGPAIRAAFPISGGRSTCWEQRAIGASCSSCTPRGPNESDRRHRRRPRRSRADSRARLGSWSRSDRSLLARCPGLATGRQRPAPRGARGDRRAHPSRPRGW